MPLPPLRTPHWCRTKTYDVRHPATGCAHTRRRLAEEKQLSHVLPDLATISSKPTRTLADCFKLFDIIHQVRCMPHALVLAWMVGA